MSFDRVIVLQCDNGQCGRKFHSAHHVAVAARQQARTANWRYVKLPGGAGGSDFCPGHAEALADTEKTE